MGSEAAPLKDVRRLVLARAHRIARLRAIGARLPPSLRDAWTLLHQARLRPTRLALAAGVGVFIGMLPLPGLQTFVWLGLVALLRVDPIVSYACTWFSNPITVVPFTVIELELGSLLVSHHWLSVDWTHVISAQVAMRHGAYLAVGGSLFATISGVATFCATHLVAQRWAAHVQATSSARHKFDEPTRSA